MSRIRLISDFESAVTSDFNWRVREISDVKQLLKDSRGGVLNAALRASVSILYAHWEGHVSNVCKRYVDFLAQRRLKYSQLLPSYMLADLHQTFKKMSEGRLTVADQIAIITRASSPADRSFRTADYEIVSSKSNLNSAVLQGICLYLSFDFAIFETEADFIDKVLIHRRNSIAHGEYLPVDLNDFNSMSGKVIGLMRTFRNAAENMLQTNAYYRP